MKDFADFKAYCQTLDIQKIEDDINEELNEYAKSNGISEEEFIFWLPKSFNHKLMIRFLEEYHNWLQG